MVDQIYYKVQYPLKKAVDLMREVDSQDLNSLKENLSDRDIRKIDNFVEEWDSSSKQKLLSLISDLKKHK